MNNFWHAALSQIVIPIAWIIAILILALALRIARIIWFKGKQRGYPPILIRSLNDKDSAGFSARLLAYLTQDTIGTDIVIPPGGGIVSPTYPIGQLPSTTGWLMAIIRIGFTNEPAFEVHVEASKPIAKNTRLCQVIVRVTRTPRNRVLAAAAIVQTNEADLVHAVGCLIINCIRKERTIMLHTPRWERWGADAEGYSAYRQALELERRGQFGAAMKTYNEAIRHSPGSFLVVSRKAALLEVIGRSNDAAETYRTCNELWPEGIEIAYRLAASYSNSKRHQAAQIVLNDIQRQLRRGSLWIKLLKTWLPTHWNVGERRYWSSWLRRRPPIFGTSKRRLFYQAVKVARVVREIDIITSSETHDPQRVSALLKELAKLTTRRSLARPYIRLLHPNCQITDWRRKQHKDGWHSRPDDNDYVMHSPTSKFSPRAGRPRRGIGWLAHYNAAIFFSIALGLEQDDLPHGYRLHEWRIDCGRASVRELGHVKRDPRNDLEDEWYRTDPGLKLLRKHNQGTRWNAFVGIEPSNSHMFDWRRSANYLTRFIFKSKS